MIKFNILIDVDDVILDNTPSMRAIISDILGYDYKEPLLNWGFNEFGEEIANKIKARISTDELFKYSEVDQEAIHYILKLKEEGHNIYFVTAIHEKNRELRRQQISEWFGEWGVRRLITTEHKYLFKGDFLIDDAPHNIVSSRCDCNIIRARDWNNKDFLIEHGVRLQNWEEIYGLISEKASQYELDSLVESWEFLNSLSMFNRNIKEWIDYNIKQSEDGYIVELKSRVPLGEEIEYDSDLETYADNFEEALIKLANKVKSKYGLGECNINLILE